MSVNDVLVEGPRPLFFLDYSPAASSTTSGGTTSFKGIASFELAGCALDRGETAECRDVARLASMTWRVSCVRLVEKDHIIDGRSIVAVATWCSASLSSADLERYSLVRRIIGEEH